MVRSILCGLIVVSLCLDDPCFWPTSLTTRWTKLVTADNVHPEYPRPQWVREKWKNLNGSWQYAVRARDTKQPAADKFDGQILVPFAIESALSGVKKKCRRREPVVVPANVFDPQGLVGATCILHFGAVDWQTTVWVNGQQVGEHRGGYDPFSFDVTDSLKPDGEQELVVGVWDPNDTGTQPRGKQIRRPHGIWYTPTTGSADGLAGAGPAEFDRPGSHRIGCRYEVGHVLDHLSQPRAASIAADDTRRWKVVGLTHDDGCPGISTSRDATGFQLWSPASHISTISNWNCSMVKRVVDKVSSYFALRKIRHGQDSAGVTRILLNNQFVFQYGHTGSRFLADGLYTAPTE